MPALAHIGIGLVAKRIAPQIPLWALLICVMAIDILSFIFLFATWISHGLFMVILWSIVSILITAFIRIRLTSKDDQDKGRNLSIWRMDIWQPSIIIGLFVFSHWVLDFIGWPMSALDPNASGVPLLFDDAVYIGLGVYSTWLGALLMDIGVFVVGLVIYVHYLKKIKKKKYSNEISPTK
ncbi:MAG: hypothetical protein ACFE91_00880 [Promethearchaeota archaeon]